MRPARPGRRARVSVTLLIVALLLGAGAGAGTFYLLGAPPKSGLGDAGLGPAREGEITALGRLEPAGGVLDILGPTTDRVLAVGDIDDAASQKADEPVLPPEPTVREGAEVKKDQVLVVLESWKDRWRELKLARTQLAEAKKRRETILASGAKQVAVAEARVKQAKEVARTEPATIDGNIALLKESLRLAETQAKALKDTRTAARLQEEERDLQVQKLKVELANAERQKTVATQSLALNVEIAEANLALARTEVERGLAEVPLELAEAKLRLAELAFERAKIRAPHDGRVLKLFVQRGEVLAGRPVLSLADVSRMVAVAEVYETSVLTLRERRTAGKPVTAKVVSPALGDFNRGDPRESKGALTGEVVSVGSQIARNRVFDLNPAADVDRRVVEVRVELKDAARAANFINLQVTVYLDVR
jgi:HlyD family secretion protein